MLFKLLFKLLILFTLNLNFKFQIHIVFTIIIHYADIYKWTSCVVLSYLNSNTYSKYS